MSELDPSAIMQIGMGFLHPRRCFPLSNLAYSLNLPSSR